jgi:hypothetical protein
VGLVLPAVPAELFHFQALGSGLLVLGGRIVAILALGALERDDVARHSVTPQKTASTGSVWVSNRRRALKKAGAVDQD